MQHPARGILCRFSILPIILPAQSTLASLALLFLRQSRQLLFLLFSLPSSSLRFLHFLVPLSPNAIIVIDFAQFSMHAALKTRSSAAASAYGSAWSLRGC